MAVTAEEIESFQHAVNELQIDEESHTIFKKLLTKLEEARQTIVQLEQEIDNFRVFGDLSVLEQVSSQEPKDAEPRGLPDSFEHLRIDTKPSSVKRGSARPAQPRSTSIQSSRWASASREPDPETPIASTPLSPSAARIKEAKAEKLAHLENALRKIDTEAEGVRGARIIGPLLRDSSGRRYDRPTRNSGDIFKYWREKKLCAWQMLRSDCRNDHCRLDHSYDHRTLTDDDFEALWAIARIGSCYVFRSKGDCTDPYCIYGHRIETSHSTQYNTDRTDMPPWDAPVRVTPTSREPQPSESAYPASSETAEAPSKYQARRNFADPDDW